MLERPTVGVDRKFPYQKTGARKPQHSLGRSRLEIRLGLCQSSLCGGTVSRRIRIAAREPRTQGSPGVGWSLSPCRFWVLR